MTGAALEPGDQVGGARIMRLRMKVGGAQGRAGVGDLHRVWAPGTSRRHLSRPICQKQETQRRGLPGGQETGDRPEALAASGLRCHATQLCDWKSHRPVFPDVACLMPSLAVLPENHARRGLRKLKEPEGLEEVSLESIVF